MKIGFTYDLETDHPIKPDDPPDALAEFDRSPTIDLIGKSNLVFMTGNEASLLTEAKSIEEAGKLLSKLIDGSLFITRGSQGITVWSNQAKLFDACADNDAAARKRGEKTFGDGKYTVGLRNEARGLREEAYHLREMVNPGNEKVYSLDGEWRYEDQKW